MKNKFMIGAISGISSLALAVPLLAQISSAQQDSSAAPIVEAEVTETVAQTAPAPEAEKEKGTHIGANGVREEILTGDTAARVTAAALAAVPGGTINRVETDAEGDVYEAHMTKSDGSRVTVKFDANFTVTKTETGGHKVK